MDARAAKVSTITSNYSTVYRKQQGEHGSYRYDGGSPHVHLIYFDWEREEPDLFGVRSTGSSQATGVITR